MTTLLGVLVGAVLTYWLQKLARTDERAEQRRARESQISTHAYALRRQLRSWLRDSHTTDTLQEWATKVSAHFDVAEERAQAVAAASAQISSGRAEAGRRAFVLFYGATESLNSAAAGDMWVWKGESTDEVVVRPGTLDGLKVARNLLQRCEDELEKAIDPELLRAEKDVFFEEPNEVP